MVHAGVLWAQSTATARCAYKDTVLVRGSEGLLHQNSHGRLWGGARASPVLTDGKDAAAAHLREGGLLAQVQVPAEVTAAADDLGEHVGAAGVSELGLLRELAHVHETKQVSVQLVHLVCDVRVQRQHLQRRSPSQGWPPGPPGCQDWESVRGTLGAAVSRHPLAPPFSCGELQRRGVAAATPLDPQCGALRAEALPQSQGSRFLSAPGDSGAH